MIIINIELKNPINLNTLLDYYKYSNSEIICKQIGYDDKIYILLKNKIYKKRGKTIRETSNKSAYSTLILTLDWNRSELTESKCISLGIYNKDFSKIQPINNKILLVDVRCKYNKIFGPEKNAVIVDLNGNIIKRYCIGDGINDCIVNEKNEIITSYFDEGIFGSSNWKRPIGSSGLIIWNEKCEIIWKADKNIYDCYAINIDMHNNLWYCYVNDYNECLLCDNNNKDMPLIPEIKGIDKFLISNYNDEIIVPCSLNGYTDFIILKLKDNKLDNYTNLSLMYNQKNLLIKSWNAFKNKAIFTDSNNRLFIKEFNKINI